MTWRSNPRRWGGSGVREQKRQAWLSSPISTDFFLGDRRSLFDLEAGAEESALQVEWPRRVMLFPLERGTNPDSALTQSKNETSRVFRQTTEATPSKKRALAKRGRR